MLFFSFQRLFLDVKQERDHLNLLHGVEDFKSENLKHTKTEEKVVLPSSQGKLLPHRGAFGVFIREKTPTFFIVTIC